MLKTVDFTILENKQIAKDVYLMALSGNTSGISASGQFVNIKLSGLYLRRPISVCDYEENKLTIIYKAVGKGTEQMSKMNVGQTLNILLPLGNGYNLDADTKNPLILGGGVGVPPMYNLAKELVKRGKKVTAVLGFNTKEDVFFKEKKEAR